MGRNILYFIYGFGDGGAEHQALQLAERMKAAGQRVHLASLLGKGELLKEAEAIVNGPVPSFPITSFYNHTMAIQLNRFIRFLRDNEIEVIHTQDFYSNIFGMVGAYLARVPARLAFKGETEFARNGTQRLVERRAFRLAHQVIVNSEGVRRYLIDEGVEARHLIRIYNGIDLGRVTSDAARSRGELAATFGLPTGPDRKFVTIVANLEHRIKNHRMFLRAAQKVSQELPHASFVIAGQGRLGEELRGYAHELGIDGKVFFIGRCDRIADLLAISDVGVLSSNAEGFSNSILEYMAAALPVVATDVGGAKEVIAHGKTGYLVESDDDASMAARIIDLLQSPDRACLMGRSGRELVSERFSWDVQVRLLNRLYESILTNHGTEHFETHQCASA